MRTYGKHIADGPDQRRPRQDGEGEGVPKTGGFEENPHKIPRGLW